MATEIREGILLIDQLEDPRDINKDPDLHCFFPGCKNKLHYVQRDTGENVVYSFGHNMFCSMEHAKIINDYSLIGENLVGITRKCSTSFDYNRDKPQNTEEFTEYFSSTDFADRAVSKAIIPASSKDGTDDGYYCQLHRITKDEFEALLYSERWHVTRDLWTPEFEEKVVFRDNEPFRVGEMIVDELCKLFREIDYLPVHKQQQSDVRKSYQLERAKPWNTWVVDVEKDHLHAWRYSKQDNDLYNKKLPLWGDKCDFANRTGLYEGIVSGQGRVVYRFLVYIGDAKIIPRDRQTGQVMPTKRGYIFQAYLHRISSQ